MYVPKSINIIYKTNPACVYSVTSNHEEPVSVDTSLVIFLGSLGGTGQTPKT